ncbi:LytR C-terminal domain-containing protein [Aeromicrobium sp. IC_218]|uniref:LytR C-terminal domain-containing protein n=1 Tax=Aeromicrobium sp. IC_218 TaxID=2545468 RepID=UPI0013F3AF2A|nr:LytR C-terminal domain-containing protein [Aeromicrobium sp. IC_218]
MSRRRITSALTLVLAAVVLVGGAAYGATLLLADADTTVEGPTCTDTVVKRGEKLTSNLVTVHVRNASQKSGLANRASLQLQRRGFLAGSVGNAPEGVKVERVTILAPDANDDMVKLVAQQLRGKVRIEKPPVGAALPAGGVTVVVGQDYAGLKRAQPAVTATQDVTVCVPNESAVE